MGKYTVTFHRTGVASSQSCNNLADVYSIIGYALSEKSAGQSINITIEKHFETRRK